MIFQLAYFPNILTMQNILKSPNIIWETNDYFQKQTYRTRCNIYSANGLLSMNIPVKHGKKERQYTKDVMIENDFKWQNNHLKTLQNAYRSSPYFEYYEDDIKKIYIKKYKFLLDFLIDSQSLTFVLIQENKQFLYTNKYQLEYPIEEDFRFLINAKTLVDNNFSKYNQVFDEKFGFIQNLSILDLIFNEGPNYRQYI